VAVTERDQDAAAGLHQNALVVDMHCDVHVDVIRRRGRGETRVLAARHLPRWREGGVNAVVLNTIPKFGPDPYPYRTDHGRRGPGGHRPGLS
jgi:hypothetical protein